MYKIFCYKLGFKKKPVIWKKTLVVHAVSGWSKPEKVGSNIFFRNWDNQLTGIYCIVGRWLVNCILFISLIFCINTTVHYSLLYCNKYICTTYHILITNRGCLRPISDMDFQFLAIWAAQGSKGKKSIFELWATFEFVFFIFSWAKKNLFF